jgi:hypothetical protein
MAGGGHRVRFRPRRPAPQALCNRCCGGAKEDATFKRKKQMSRQAAAGICATTPIAGAKTIEEPDALKGKSHA